MQSQSPLGMEPDGTDQERAAPSSTEAASEVIAKPSEAAAGNTTDAANASQPAGKRDDWMSEANARPLFSADAAEAEETQEQKQAARAERMKASPQLWNAHWLFCMWNHPGKAADGRVLTKVHM